MCECNFVVNLAGKPRERHADPESQRVWIPSRSIRISCTANADLYDLSFRVSAKRARSPCLFCVKIGEMNLGHTPINLLSSPLSLPSSCFRANPNFSPIERTPQCCCMNFRPNMGPRASRRSSNLNKVGRPLTQTDPTT